MFSTKKRKMTVELLGQSVKGTGRLSSIEETEEMSEEGIEIRNVVERGFYACGHRHAGKEQGLVVCAVCNDIWCPQCAEKGSLCDGCGRWLCAKHTHVSVLTGAVLCPDCGLPDVVKKKLKEGGIMKWLDWSS